MVSICTGMFRRKYFNHKRIGLYGSVIVLCNSFWTMTTAGYSLFETESLLSVTKPAAEAIQILENIRMQRKEHRNEGNDVIKGKEFLKEQFKRPHDQ